HRAPPVAGDGPGSVRCRVAMVGPDRDIQDRRRTQEIRGSKSQGGRTGPESSISSRSIGLGNARPTPALPDGARRTNLWKCHTISCRGIHPLVGKAMLVLMGMVISASPGSAKDSAPDWKIAPPGVKEFQVPFASIKPEAIFKIGEDADWVQITANSVWVASSKP